MATNSLQEQFQCPNWTTNDKIFQYEKLNSLYDRNQKFNKNNKKVIFKRALKVKQTCLQEIRRLRSDDLILKKGIQQVRFFNNRKEFDLKFRNFHSCDIIQYLKQENFRLRTILDLNYNERFHKETQLIQLRNAIPSIEYAIEKVQFVSSEESKSRDIYCKIDEIIFKRRTILNLTRRYENILQVLQTEAIYFDFAIDKLQKENEEQIRRIYHFIKNGQAVKDFVQEQKTEFREHRISLRKMDTEKETNLKRMRNEIKIINGLITDLTKRPNLKTLSAEFKNNLNETAISNMKYLESDLTLMQNAVFASHFNEILPRIQQQLEQRDYLTGIQKHMEEKRDYYKLKKTNYEFRLNETKHLLSEEILQFKIETENMRNAKKDILVDLTNFKNRMNQSGIVLTNILCYLERFQKILSIFQARGSKAKQRLHGEVLDFSKLRSQLLIDHIKTKLEYLQNLPKCDLNRSKQMIYAKDFIGLLIIKFQPIHVMSSKDKSLILSFDNVIEINQAVTRTDIKNRSSNIVYQHFRELYG